jgi:hypothetical protein
MVGNRTASRAIVIFCALLLSSCILKPGSGLDKNKKFKSPLSPVGDIPAESATAFIFQRLQERAGGIQTIRADFDLLAGGGIRGKQMIRANMAIQVPGFLRVRGVQNEGTLFDILINRDTVQLLIPPQQQYFRGTIAQLQQNQEILAGINPEDLMDHFSVEQTLLSRLAAVQFPPETDKTHYLYRFQLPNGTTEVYHLRKQDLLCDLFEKFYGQQLISMIRYWSYQYYGGYYLLPNEFTIALPDKKGEFAANVTSVKVNEPVPDDLQQMRVPDGFERMALGR